MAKRFNRVLLPLGAFLAGLAVLLGAYGAHGLDKLLVGQGYESDLAKRLDWFETGVRYQMYHALGLLLAWVCWQPDRIRRLCLKSVGVLFVLGIGLFSGSLYGMTLLPENFRWLGAVTPLGGLSLIAGWGLLAWKSWQSA